MTTLAGAVALAAKDHPFETELGVFQNHMDINTTSAFVAIKEAVASFEKVPATTARTFIYTGNAMNFSPFAGIMTLGIGKSASAHMLAAAAQAYKGKGYKYVVPFVSHDMIALTNAGFTTPTNGRAMANLVVKALAARLTADFTRN